jgi:hypothetical protein
VLFVTVLLASISLTWQAALDDFIVEACATDEHNEPNHLQGVEGLPARVQGVQPDEHRAAGINGGTSSATQRLGHCTTQQPQQRRSQ